MKVRCTEHAKERLKERFELDCWEDTVIMLNNALLSTCITFDNKGETRSILIDNKEIHARIDRGSIVTFLPPTMVQDEIGVHIDSLRKSLAKAVKSRNKINSDKITISNDCNKLNKFIDSNKVILWLYRRWSR